MSSRDNHSRCRARAQTWRPRTALFGSPYVPDGGNGLTRAILGPRGRAVPASRSPSQGAGPHRRVGRRAGGAKAQGPHNRWRAPGSRCRCGPRLLRAGRLPHALDQVRVEAVLTRGAVTIVERPRRGVRTSDRSGRRPRSLGCATPPPAESGRSIGQTVTPAGIDTTGSSPPPRSQPCSRRSTAIQRASSGAEGSHRTTPPRQLGTQRKRPAAGGRPPSGRRINGIRRSQV
jgi:hypothetical protein